MSAGAPGRRARWRWAIVAAVAVLGAAVFAPTRVWEPALAAAGAVLVASDEVTHVDAIVVTLHSGSAGAIEAADLVRAGIADRVLVFDEPPRPATLELQRRGLAPITDTTRQIEHLARLGVSTVERITDVPSLGTGAEAQALAGWCREHALRTVLVVTSADHARRMRRVLARELEPVGTAVAVRPARHSDFDASQWWRTTDGRRIAIVEWQKLIVDWMSHPL
jgi:uncharacterized SAM-binding protein YcdF (DUF218 family)